MTPTVSAMNRASGESEMDAAARRAIAAESPEAEILGIWN